MRCWRECVLAALAETPPPAPIPLHRFPVAPIRCLQFVNEEHFALREFFCIPCDPEQYKYMSMTKDSDDDWGEIRICSSFAERVWPSVPVGENETNEYRKSTATQDGMCHLEVDH